MNVKFLFGMMKKFWIRVVRWLHNIVNVLNATEVTSDK